MCLTKEKLLVISGAGASIDFGMYSSSDIENMFEKEGSTKLNVDGRQESLYEYVKEQLQRYHQSNHSPCTYNEKKQKSIGFEEIVYNLLRLFSVLEDDHTDGFASFFDLKKFPPKVDNTKLVPFDFYNEADELIALLLENMREKCNAVFFEKIAKLKHFMTKLEKKFKLSVVNLNYDNILYRGMSSRKVTGFDNFGVFDPELVLKNQKWNFFYHLHGSVHFYYTKPENSLEIKFAEDCNRKDVTDSNKARRSPMKSTEGFPIMRNPIIVGYGKSLQIQREPYLFYYNDLSRRVYEADKILFVGYSFSDEHLNNLVKMSLNHKKKKKIVIISYSDDRDGFRQRFDKWTDQVRDTIPVEMLDFDSCSTKRLPEDDPFDRSISGFVSILYKGFGFCLDHPEIIVSELKG